MRGRSLGDDGGNDDDDDDDDDNDDDGDNGGGAVILVQNSTDNEIIQEKSDEEIQSLSDRRKLSLSNLTLKGWIVFFPLLCVIAIFIRTVVRFIRRFWPGFCDCNLLEVGKQVWRKATKTKTATVKTKKDKNARPNWDNCGEVIYDSRGPPPPFVRVTFSEGESDDKSIP